MSMAIIGDNSVRGFIFPVGTVATSLPKGSRWNTDKSNSGSSFLDCPNSQMPQFQILRGKVSEICDI